MISWTRRAGTPAASRNVQQVVRMACRSNLRPLPSIIGIPAAFMSRRKARRFRGTPFGNTAALPDTPMGRTARSTSAACGISGMKASLRFFVNLARTRKNGYGSSSSTSPQVNDSISALRSPEDSART